MYEEYLKVLRVELKIWKRWWWWGIVAVIGLWFIGIFLGNYYG